MHSLCSVNGEISDLAEARIDPQDRGLLFGDSLYEVIRVVGGRLLFLEPHLRRLDVGLAKTRIARPDDLARQCEALVARSELVEGYLYIQVTRGVAPRSHRPPDDARPTVLILPYDVRYDPPGSKPLRAATVPDWRWHFCDLKTTSLMATVLGKLRAAEEEVDEILFVGPQRTLREGGSTNLFVRQNERLLTHPLDGSILEGVTRALVLELAAGLGLEVEEQAPRLAEVAAWQEAFLTSTTVSVQPLVAVDRRPVADAHAGEWTIRIAAAYADLEAKQQVFTTPT